MSYSRVRTLDESNLKTMTAVNWFLCSFSIYHDKYKYLHDGNFYFMNFHSEMRYWSRIWYNEKVLYWWIAMCEWNWTIDEQVVMLPLQKCFNEIFERCSVFVRKVTHFLVKGGGDCDSLKKSRFLCRKNCTFLHLRSR